MEWEVEMNLIFRFECPDERELAYLPGENFGGRQGERICNLHWGLNTPGTHCSHGPTRRHPQDIRVCPHILQDPSLLPLTDGWLRTCYYGMGKCRHECRTSEKKKERCGDFTVCCIQISKSKLYYLPPVKDPPKKGMFHVRLPA